MAKRLFESVKELAVPCHCVNMASQTAPIDRRVAGPIAQESALAEFATLREEIISRQGHQVTLFSLQLTLTGAVLGYALSGTGRSLVLLVVRSRLLCSVVVMSRQVWRGPILGPISAKS